jgi:hypothetical protein
MKYKITGQICEKESGLPVKGLNVRAYDQDLLWDDLLGTATTDENGNFGMDYSSKDFSELWEARPDIYLMVYAPPRTLLYKTKDSVRAGAKEEEHFALEIDRATLGPFSPTPPNDAPMLHERVVELEDRPAKIDPPKGVMVELDRFYAVADHTVEPNLRIDEQTGAFIIEAPFILKHREFPSIEAEPIDTRKIRTIDVKAELDGNLPDHLSVRYRPELFQGPRKIDAGLDIPNAVFTPDTRYIYRDTAFPWSTVGRVDTEDGY